MAADRIKRLQGKEVTEKPLDYWSDKKKEDEDIEEKEELIKKYVTMPKTAPVSQTKSSGMSRGKITLLIFVVVAFFVGTGYGVYVMSIPENNSSNTLTVNDSAFPLNNTNITANTTSSSSSDTTSTKTSTTNKTVKKTTTPTSNKTTTPTKTTTNSSK